MRVDRFLFLFGPGRCASCRERLVAESYIEFHSLDKIVFRCPLWMAARVGDVAALFSEEEQLPGTTGSWRRRFRNASGIDSESCITLRHPILIESMAYFRMDLVAPPSVVCMSQIQLTAVLDGELTTAVQ